MLPNGFCCFAKVPKSHRGIVKTLMFFDDSGGRYAGMSRNYIEYDRFYKGILIDFAGVGESSIPTGFPWFLVGAKSHQDLLIIVMVFDVFSSQFPEMPPG